jgi:hypothetical protein
MNSSTRGMLMKAREPPKSAEGRENQRSRRNFSEPLNYEESRDVIIDPGRIFINGYYTLSYTYLQGEQTKPEEKSVKFFFFENLTLFFNLKFEISDKFFQKIISQSQ